MNHRIASLDFLRGVAAFAVAIPHFFMARGIGTELAETISILGVEIFFVLSGFVLAPQILYVAIEQPSLQNLGIFLVRRWMRTVPAYLIALIVISLTARELWSADFARYALYLQNLFHQVNDRDYFSIAWSLSVEEWFYVTFPLLALGLGRFLPRPALIGLLFIAAITALRFAAADWSHWGGEVRRVVIFRLDAIAWGFVLYLGTERTALLRIMSPARSLAVLLAASTFAVLLTDALAGGAFWLKASFHVYASLFGAVTIIAALSLRNFFEASPRLTSIGLFLGRISYSTYLFHLLLLSALAHPFAAMHWSAFLSAYIAATAMLAALMSLAIEAPILAARPGYRKLVAENEALTPTRSESYSSP